MVQRDDVALLRALAAKEGFTVQAALAPDRWRLIEEKNGKLVVNRQGSAAFTFSQALAFLRLRSE
jgi:hypothetical protein